MQNFHINMRIIHTWGNSPCQLRYLRLSKGKHPRDHVSHPGVSGVPVSMCFSVTRWLVRVFILGYRLINIALLSIIIVLLIYIYIYYRQCCSHDTVMFLRLPKRVMSMWMLVLSCQLHLAEHYPQRWANCWVHSWNRKWRLKVLYFPRML